MNRDNSTETILEIYRECGEKDYMGEKMSQTDHAVQCAQFALSDNAPKEIVLAALLHDLGHLLGLHPSFCDRLHLMKDSDSSVIGVHKHENVGAAFLEEKFVKKQDNPTNITSATCRLIRNHVNTKRFLAAPENDGKKYIEKNLSVASQLTLKQQGGPMKAEECANFRKNEQEIQLDDDDRNLLDWHLLLRKWDDDAKIVWTEEESSKSFQIFTKIFEDCIWRQPKEK